MPTLGRGFDEGEDDDDDEHQRDEEVVENLVLGILGLGDEGEIGRDGPVGHHQFHQAVWLLLNRGDRQCEVAHRRTHPFTEKLHVGQRHSLIMVLIINA